MDPRRSVSSWSTFTYLNLLGNTVHTGGAINNHYELIVNIHPRLEHPRQCSLAMESCRDLLTYVSVHKWVTTSVFAARSRYCVYL